MGKTEYFHGKPTYLWITPVKSDKILKVATKRRLQEMMQGGEFHNFVALAGGNLPTSHVYVAGVLKESIPYFLVRFLRC